ncbi:MAG: NHLP family bacteriocin export ABC transporter peptidase/permease/ATPase subunit [Betaproteobacteria bacterium]
MLAGRPPRARRARRVRTPIVLQLESLECGAAALSIVLRHYGCYVSLEELRQRCGVTRDGSKASNILKAARGYGLTAKGFKKEPAELRAFAAPFIVFWNFNHFVVVDGFDGERVHINDPAWGRRIVNADEFDQSFTGVVLTFEPGAQFKPVGQPESIYRAAFKRLTGDRSALAFLVLAGLFMVVPGLVLPVFTALFIDRVLVDGQASWALPVVLGLGCVAAIHVALSWLQNWYLVRLQTKLVLSMASRFFWHLLHLPHAFFTQRAPGEIGWRLMLNDNVAGVITGDLARAVVNGMLAVFFFAVMLTYDVALSFMSLAVVIANLAVFQLVTARTQESSLALAITQGKLQGTAASGLSVIETLRATAAEAGFFTKFAGFLAQHVQARQRMETLGIYFRQVPAFLMLANEAAILCFGGLRVIEGHLTIGMLVAFMGLVHSFISPAVGLVGLMDRVQHLRGDLQRIDDVLNYARDPLADGVALYDAAQAPGAPGKLAGRVELRDVSFGYNPNDEPLLRSFSMAAAPGERIALVGRSGCGKSTVAKLISGLYAPFAGEVTFDGRPRERYSRLWLAGSVSLVDQDITLFEGTFRDNLTMWDPTIAESDIIAAAKDALIHDFIMSRPLGYDGAVGEGGRNMSGGQRQRLEIARALVGKPSVLVLDEATSALDTSTEELLEHNLRRRGCTCIVIAHRLSAIRDCDRILVLKDGRLVEEGALAELLAMRGGHYRELLEQG